MEGQRLEVDRPFRSPKIKITRRCGLCQSNAELAIVLLLIGALQGQIVICVRCVISASHDLAARRDVVIKIETLPGGGGGILLGDS